MPPLSLAIATAAENDHSDILRYFFTNMPQRKRSSHGPWVPKEEPTGPEEHEITKEWRSALGPDLVVRRTLQASKPAAFQTLMDFGLSIHHILDKTGTPITLAVYRQDVEMVRFLLSKGANPNDFTWVCWQTVLSCAASLPSVEILSLLLGNGGKIQGSQSLLGAAETGHIDAATMLLAHGADINETFRFNLWDDDPPKDDSLGTALHIAVREDQKDFIIFLLQRGARLDLTDGEGRTPLQLAHEFGNTDMTRLLDIPT